MSAWNDFRNGVIATAAMPAPDSADVRAVRDHVAACLLADILERPWKWIAQVAVVAFVAWWCGL